MPLPHRLVLKKPLSVFRIIPVLLGQNIPYSLRKNRGSIHTGPKVTLEHVLFLYSQAKGTASSIQPTREIRCDIRSWREARPKERSLLLPRTSLLLSNCIRQLTTTYHSAPESDALFWPSQTPALICINPHIVRHIYTHAERLK